MKAASHGNVDIAKLLISTHIDVNIQCSQEVGYRLLTCAEVIFQTCFALMVEPMDLLNCLPVCKSTCCIRF